MIFYNKFRVLNFSAGVIKFDLSPAVVVKFKDNLQTFLDDVIKMAKLMQPSMLFIDGAHYPFIKKVHINTTAKVYNIITYFRVSR